MAGQSRQQPPLGPALQRVGSTGVDRFRWLLRFAQRDLGNLPSDQWRQLEDELYVFPLGSGHVMIERPSERRWSPKRAEILKLQKTLAEGIRCFAWGSGWRIDVQAAKGPSLRRPISRWVFRDGRSGYVGDDWPCVFQMAAADLLMTVGPRLRKCEDCETLFLPAKNQTFCSPRCSRRVRIRRYRQRLRGKQPSTERKN